jgi:hypothetical protein
MYELQTLVCKAAYLLVEKRSCVFPSMFGLRLRSVIICVLM